MKRTLVSLGVLVAAVVLLRFFPLFHLVSRDGLLAERQQSAFSAAKYVKEFWTSRLTPALGHAADAAAVLAMLRGNPEQARSRFGRSAGLGRASLYFVRGNGTIVSVDEKTVGVSLDDGNEADIALATGLLFGNTVRDATGLLDASDYPNSQHFNEISTELNRTVEATVIPSLKERAHVGDAIEFVGCAEVTNVPRDFTPLKIVPLEVHFK